MFDRNKKSPTGTQEESSRPFAPATTSEPRTTPAPAPSHAPQAQTQSHFSRPVAATSGRAASIGATIVIKGDVTGDEDLTIEGQVEGSVNLHSHELIIGPTGKLKANITAKVIRIDGEVQGDIVGTEKVIVSSTSNIKGNIVTPKMTLEEGARFKGSIDIDPDAKVSSSPAASASSATASSAASSTQPAGAQTGGDKSKSSESGSAAKSSDKTS